MGRRVARKLRPIHKAARQTAGQADGESERAEERAAHIAKHIGECADALGVEPCDLTWWDFRAYGQVAWASNTLGIVRRDITRLGGFNSIRDAYYPPTATDHAQTKKRIREHANLNRRLGAHSVADLFEFKQIEAFSKRVFSGRVQPVVGKPSVKPRGKCPIKRAAVVVLSDLHFGADLDARETGFADYGPLEEARSLAEVVRQVCTYKLEYRDETELIVVIDGDLIHGCLHDVRDGAALSEQQLRAIHLLSQAVAQFSAAFRRVRVVCVTGNHDRDKYRHPKKANAGKADSRATVIYWATKFATAHLSNVEWVIPQSQFATFRLFGKRYYVTHGDGCISVGNPGKSINVAKIEEQINKLNANLPAADAYSVVIVAHAHKSLQLLLDNGVTLIVNGPLTPVDSFAVSVGVFRNTCSQQMFEVVPGHPVGDSRTIKIDSKVRRDRTLDKVIRKWPGLQ